MFTVCEHSLSYANIITQISRQLQFKKTEQEEVSHPQQHRSVTNPLWRLRSYWMLFCSVCVCVCMCFQVNQLFCISLEGISHWRHIPPHQSPRGQTYPQSAGNISDHHCSNNTTPCVNTGNELMNELMKQLILMLIDDEWMRKNMTFLSF